MIAFIIKFVLRFCTFNFHSLSIRLLVSMTLEFWKILNISFPNEQEKLDLFKCETKIEFCLNNSTTKVFSKIKMKPKSKINSKFLIA